VSIPGPPAAVLVVGLLGLGLAVALLGEGVRQILARWTGAWSNLEAVERGLLDFYLGGAVLYLLAALPIGAFSHLSVEIVLFAGAVGMGFIVIRRGRRHELSASAWVRPLVRPAAVLALAAGLGVLVFEVLVAYPIGTGNTYDSSLLTFYTARLLAAHDLPLSFAPSASLGILYPQGATAWLGTAQLILGLPGARTSLLLTPLFFGLAPVGGFVLGRRLFGGDLAGVALALMLGAVASWTRVLVGGSNDFVFAFPLVLLLAGLAIGWTRALPSRGEAVAFGLMVGYSAAMNPVGAEWLMPGLLLMALMARPRWAGSARRWLTRWSTAVVCALVPLLPTWYVVARGVGTPGYLPGSGSSAATPPGVELGRFIGWVDPFLFRPTDVALSPVPVLRAELALLLTIGVALLLFAGRRSLGERFATVRDFLLAGVLVILALLVVNWVGSTGNGRSVLGLIVSSSEASIWLFTFFSLIATLPLVLVLEVGARGFRRAESRTAPDLTPPDLPTARRRADRAVVVPVVLALVILLPGLALTPTQLAPTLTTLYTDFGNVTADDFDLLSYVGTHVPGGARVLVAPGSAGEFLPAYDPTAVLLYPMLPGGTHVNASYALVVRQLTNGTLTTTGQEALEILGVEFILVTQNNSILWPAFSPLPLESSAFPELFAEGDAYLFEVRGAGPPGAIVPR
jgi:hypothetical protein